MQLFVYKCKFAYFVIWTPQYCEVIKIDRDLNFDKNIELIQNFYKKHILHELVTRQIENNIDLFCYCRQPYSNTQSMVGCDNRKCTGKWFHFSCANIEDAPIGKWYCNNCQV